MSEYKIVLGYIATAVNLISAVPYFIGLYKGKLKPHAFSWFVWGLLTGIGFAIQIISGAGPGAWPLGIASLISFIISAIGFWQGHVIYTKFDWIAFSGALLAIILWQLTNNPLTAVIFVSISDLIALLPSWRKSYNYPSEESAVSFALGSLSFFISLFALESFTITNWLYPVVICLANTSYAMMILIRRRQLKQN